MYSSYRSSMSSSRKSRRPDRPQEGVGTGRDPQHREHAGAGLAAQGEGERLDDDGEADRAPGVDDWAWRRGRRYGTVLVDLERRRVVDLLDDRTAASLADWLTTHPGVTVLTRDRSETYADGARRGAPGAVQVADRWHLAKNLGEAVEALLDRHRRHLRQLPWPAAPPAAPRPGPSLPAGAPAGRARGRPPGPRLTQPETLQATRRAKRLARYEQLLALRAQGEPIAAAARAVGIGERTAHRWLASGRFPERKQRRRGPGPLDPYRPYLDAQWAAGRRRGIVLWRALGAQGYTGSLPSVYTYLYRLRGRDERAARGPGAPPPPAGVPPGGPPEGDPARPSPPDVAPRVRPRQVRGLMLRPAGELDDAERQYLTALHERCPDTRAASRLAQEFLGLLRQRPTAAEAASGLAAWLAAADASGPPELRRFAAGLRRDREAVEAALSSPWSNGQTEGQVHRLKALRRQMYGRGKLDLLRRRLLRAA